MYSSEPCFLIVKLNDPVYIPRITLTKIEHYDKGEMVVILQSNLLSKSDSKRVMRGLIHKVSHLSENKRQIGIQIL